MLNIWSLITKVTFILTFLAYSSLQACVTDQAPFPKIIGGIQGATQFYQIDYNPVSGHLIGGGFSQDQGVRGDSLGTTGYPIVAAYKGAEFSYQWGKAFSNLQNFDYFTGVKINRAGTRLVVPTFFATLYVIVLDINNGNVITAIKQINGGNYNIKLLRHRFYTRMSSQNQDYYRRKYIIIVLFFI